MTENPHGTRRRLSWDQRTRQLLDTAWTVIEREGTDALTLGRLAEAGGVAKPVVYDHFGTREGLLAVLYEDYDRRQTAVFEAAIAKARATLSDQARVIASSYVDCVLTEGREVGGVLAALSGSPKLAAMKREYQQAFMEKCAAILAPFSGPRGMSPAQLWTILGAADALSQAAVAGEITDVQARDELHATVLGIVRRAKMAGKPAQRK